MPDRTRPTTAPSLDRHLVAARTELLDEINPPPLDQITGRAAALRRRRRVRRAGMALVVVTAGVLLLHPWASDPEATVPPADDPPTHGLTYAAAGITIDGLTGSVARLPDLPGKIVDVEFASPDQGYLLAADCAHAPCTVTFARTEDAGLTWHNQKLPTDTGSAGSAGAAAVPDLILFPGGGLAAASGHSTVYLSANGGRTWQLAPAADAGPTKAIAQDELLRLQPAAGQSGTGPSGTDSSGTGHSGTGPSSTGQSGTGQSGTGQGGTGQSGTGQGAAGSGDGCRGGTLQVWSPRYGYRGELASQLPIEACWVAARATADGAWWIGGVESGNGGRAAAAVSRDGGRTWRAVPFEVPLAGTVGAVQLSTLGSHVYAVVLGRHREILAILHSANGGQTFTPTRQLRTGSAAAQPATLAGEAVPLLDGRLLITTGGGEWYVATGDGASFTRAKGDLPAVGQLRRTWAGYVAYDLFGTGPDSAGWAAFSPDGSAWRKLHIR